MSMVNVGRQTRPETVAEPPAHNLGGGRGLLQDEPLLFELGGWMRAASISRNPPLSPRGSARWRGRTRSRCRGFPSPRRSGITCGCRE